MIYLYHRSAGYCFFIVFVSVKTNKLSVLKIIVIINIIYNTYI